MNIIEKRLEEWRRGDCGRLRRVFVITDTGVDRMVMPRIVSVSPTLAEAEKIVIGCGEDNKNIRTVEYIWNALMSAGATRHDLVVNVGGGMVSDTGGFAASTFKRGMAYANVATTLLAAADASIGGKTGVNLGGLKNAVGTFALPLGTEAFPDAFSTLPMVEILSGYGEILKMALIADSGVLGQVGNMEKNIYDLYVLGELARMAANRKMVIVSEDPCESGLRKILNFGHTFGHALEGLALRRRMQMAHGIAVAYGIVCALVLSRMICGCSSDLLYYVANDIVRPGFGTLGITCADYAELLALMRNDKKNSDGDIRFVLLEDAGKPVYDISVSEDDIKAALDICRDLLA